MRRAASQITTIIALITISFRAGHAGHGPLGKPSSLLSHSSTSPTRTSHGSDKLSATLAAQLASRDSDQRLNVIVRYRSGSERAASGLESRILRRLSRDHSVAVRLTRAEVRQLAASEAVESIEPDLICHEFRGGTEESYGVAKACADFGLTGDGDGDPKSFSSQDHTIAILDTGIDPNHPDFAGGKVIGWKDFVNGRPIPYDDRGHGTHVASIAAAGVVQGQHGAAPGAALVAVKVLDQNGGGSASLIASAVQWCIDNRTRYGIRVLNLSLGSDISSDGTDVLSRMVDQATEAGIVVCAAAGNSGPATYTVGSPAAAQSAITVGSIRDLGQGGFLLDTFSSRGPTADQRVKPDLCAPGYRVQAAGANTTGYIVKSGTSMASPFVAGVAALMLEANNNLTPAQVKSLMKETAVHFGPAGVNNDYGVGRLDGYAALARATGTAGTPPDMPAHSFVQSRLSGFNATDRWSLAISDIRFPIAATLLMDDGSATLKLSLLDPDGNPIQTFNGPDRQRTISFRPARTGTYTLLVQGASRYTLDLSAGSGSAPQEDPKEVLVFRPSTDDWFLRTGTGPVVVKFGGMGDVPEPADYLGAGSAQIAVFRPATDEWFIRDGSGATHSFQFGGAGDQPVPGNYLRLARSQIAVFRPSTAQWFVRSDTGEATSYQWGAPGDLPVAADYAGKGYFQIAVFRPSTGQWFIRPDAGDATVVQWGGASDLPLPGDYLGLGYAQIAVFRPSTAEWFIRQTDGTATILAFGAPGDVPVPADYFASGHIQIAVFRPSTAEWFIRTDHGQAITVQWGGRGDLPVPAGIPAP